MRNPKHLLIPALAALLLLGLIGCSDSDRTTPTGTSDVAIDDYTAIDLDEPYGGLTMTDEEPAFGDAYLVELDAREADEAIEDELLNDPEVRRLQAMGEAQGNPNDPARPRFTFLRIVWGNLDGEADRNDPELIDWTGQLSVDRGIVLVRRVILFERPYDHIVRPRPDRHTMAWTSHTGPHVDGLIVQIIEPPLNGGHGDGGNGGNGDGQGGDPEDPPAPNVLHFTTGPFTQDFVIDELSGLDEIYEVEPAGNGIHFAGFTLGDLNVCPKGFLEGHWLDDPENEIAGGTFRGRWVDIFGLVRGYMLGTYGLNDAEEPVFAGKYVGRNGQFVGLVAGTWAPGDEIGRGTFEGHWMGETEQIEGVLGGRYLQLPDRPCGLYQGRWAADCDDEAVREITD